jgi:hypothetical protein
MPHGLPAGVSYDDIDGGVTGDCENCELAIHDDNESREVDVYRPVDPANIDATIAQGWKVSTCKAMIYRTITACQTCEKELAAASAIVLLAHGGTHEAAEMLAKLRDDVLVDRHEYDRLKEPKAAIDTLRMQLAEKRNENARLELEIGRLRFELRVLRTTTIDPAISDEPIVERVNECAV